VFSITRDYSRAPDGRDAGIDQRSGNTCCTLRVCSETFLDSAKPSDHEANRGEEQEGAGLQVEVLPVLGQSGHLLSQASVRSTTHGLGNTTKPFWRSDRLTIRNYAVDSTVVRPDKPHHSPG
jgi:hypothetical protein